MSDYLRERGWEPCLDGTHTHPFAGTGEVLHPKDCDNPNGIYAPAELTTYDDAIMKGLAR